MERELIIFVARVTLKCTSFSEFVEICREYCVPVEEVLAEKKKLREI